MLQVRKRVIVSGEVQKVGYRDHVQRLGRKFEVVGYVENLRDGFSVEIICEGKKSSVESFVREIKKERGKRELFNPFVYIEDVCVLDEVPTGKFNYFEIKRGPVEEELGDHFDMAVGYLGIFSNQTRQDFKRPDEEYDRFSKKLDEMGKNLARNLEDINETLKKIVQGVAKPKSFCNWEF